MKAIKEKEIIKLINKVKKNNCNTSFCKLLEIYESFFYSISSKYTLVLSSIGVSREDISSEKEFVLFKAIQSFSTSPKTKFSTWFCNCTKYHFLNMLNVSKKHSRFDKDEFFFNSSESTYFSDVSKKDTLEYLLALLSSFKDERIEKVYKLRYFSGGVKPATWDYVAKKVGISTQTAINLHEKTKVFLKKKITSGEFCDLV